MSYYKLNGQPAADSGLDDSGAAGPSLQQAAGNPAPAVPSAASVLGGETAPEFPDFEEIIGHSPAADSSASTVDSTATANNSTATSSTTQTVTTSGSGLVFNNTFGPGVSPSSPFINEVIAAEHYLQSQFGNACTVNCSFDLQSLNKAFSGENNFSPIEVSYSTLVNALETHATTPEAQAAAAALAGLSDPSNGALWEIPVGEAQILGLTSSDGVNDDKVVLNNFYWTSSALQNNPGDAEAVIEHELTEGIMGRIGSLGTDGDWAPMDLFRFTASGQRDFTGGSDGKPTYFSADGTNVYTGLQYHNSINASGQFDGFDLSDWDQVGADANATDPFGPGGPGAGDPGTLSATDIQIMQALGWAPPSSETVVRNDSNAYGSVDLAQVGNNYFLYAHGTTTGPELSYNGAPVTVGEFGPWTPFGAALTSTGYDVAWKVPGANQYTVWQINSSGQFLSSLGLVTGTNNTFESYEMILNQDLNGDGTIGVTDTNTLGSATVSAVGNQYSISSGGGSVTLQYSGAPVTAGEFGPWTPFGVALTSTGYDVAWEVPGANQYTAWQINSSGQFLSSLGLVTGTNNTFESYEMVLNQDLNGDGTIGITDTNGFGATTLSEVANHYAISNGGASVTLQYNGAAVAAGDFGPWLPFGAARTSTGYDVAWEIPGANQYTAWSTDFSGNFTSNLTGGVGVPGNNSQIIQLENVFNQDLNGNGTTGGAPIATIQSQDSPTGLPTNTGAPLLSDNLDTTPASFEGAASSSSDLLSLLDPTSVDASLSQALGGGLPESGSLPAYSLSDFDFVGDAGSGGNGPSALQSSLSQAGAILDAAGSNGIAGPSQFAAPSLSTLGLAAGLGAAVDNSAAIEPPATPTLAIAGLYHT